MLVNRMNFGKQIKNVVMLMTFAIALFAFGRYTRNYFSGTGATELSEPGSVSELSGSSVSEASGPGTSDVGDTADQTDPDGVASVAENAVEEEEIQGEPEEIVEIIKSLEPAPWVYNDQYKNPCWIDGLGVLQCLPYFFIPGMVDSGTSYLFRAIMQHPETAYPGFEEANFFQTKDLADLNQGEIYDYVGMYADAAQTIWEHTTSQANPNQYNNIVTGDASSYLSEWWNTNHTTRQEFDESFNIMQYVFHLIPQAKVIVIFRNPVDRLYSEYCRRSIWPNDPDWPSPDHFHEKAQHALNMFNMLFRSTSLKKCAYDKESLNRTEVGLFFGMHYFYWTELLSVFPREQLLLLHYRTLFTEDTIRLVFAFLGMAPPSPDVLYRIWLLRRGGQPGVWGHCGTRGMHFRTRVLLNDFYAPYNEIMADLQNDDEFLYSI